MTVNDALFGVLRQFGLSGALELKYKVRKMSSHRRRKLKQALQTQITIFKLTDAPMSKTRETLEEWLTPRAKNEPH